jgi:hypothetical protein
LGWQVNWVLGWQVRLQILIDQFPLWWVAGYLSFFLALCLASFRGIKLPTHLLLFMKLYLAFIHVHIHPSPHCLCRSLSKPYPSTKTTSMFPIRCLKLIS